MRRSEVAWGLLPVGVALLAVLTVGLGALALPGANGFDRLVAGGVLAMAATVATVSLLAAVGVLSTPALLAAVVAGAGAVVVAVRVRRAPWRMPWRAAVSAETLPVLVVTAAALGLAIVAAYYLPVWQWDALGYHLPYVNLVLQSGSFADVPAGVPYLSSYPHLVELAFTAWRALLPDDRLVELAHLPFGLLGAAAIAAIAYRHGARPAYATVAGAVWLTLPAVFLQLPTNYTDVASAALLLSAIALVLSPLDRTRVLLAAVAIGLFLGAKPQAPVAAAMLLVLLTVLAWRRGLGRAAVGAWLLALAIGGRIYLVNIIRHGNPVWPVRIDLGPVHLPGPRSVADLLASGAAAPHVDGNLVVRVAKSWSTLIPPLPVFDMRVGGLGLLFVVALPFAVVGAVRTRSPAVAVCAAATLATPDPAVARYVLAFAGLTLAFAVPALGWRRLGGVARTAVVGAVAVAAAWNVVLAYPGLTGEGPALSAYPGMTLAERQRAVGADGVPTPYLDAIGRVGPGEVTVLDAGAELPYLAWPSDLSGRAVYVPADTDEDVAERIMLAPEVRMLIVGDDTVGGLVARRNPQVFARGFRCHSAPCTVYLRR